MALAQGTDVLLLDEPTTFLDLAHQVDVLELVRRLHTEKGRTVVMVLHDLNLAARYAERLIAMQDGAIAASPPGAAVATDAARRIADRCRSAQIAHDTGLLY
jgi:iron complex transport system ATP-binding protein